MKKIYLPYCIIVGYIYSCKRKNRQLMPPQPFEVYEIETKSVPIYQEFVGKFMEKKIFQ